MGHSFGGAAAAEVVRQDKRFKGGINLDGRLFNPVLKQGLDRPFLLLGRPNHTAEDATWNKAWGKLSGPKALAKISGTLHASYTDMLVLVQSLGLPEEVQPQIQALVGSVDGIRLQRLEAEIISAFSLFASKKSSDPLTAVAKQYPEIVIAKNSPGRG